MKTNWVVSVYKADKRFKAGERFVAKYPFSGMDRASLERSLRELTWELYPGKDGWRFDVQGPFEFVESILNVVKRGK